MTVQDRQPWTAATLAQAALAGARAKRSGGAFVAWRDIARPNQLPPSGEWRIWLLLAGRGFGKTRSLVEFGHEQAEAMPGSRGALVGATAADTRDVLVLGESGLLATARPDFRPEYQPSKRLVIWPNGSQAMLFSADEPDRLRGLQHHWALADELAAWRRLEAWDMLLMTMRLGDNPRVGVATTPRPIKLLKGLLTDPTVAVTKGTTRDNAANLAKPFLDAIIQRYEGTRLGRQELEAVMLDDAPGALWKRGDIDDGRVLIAPELTRVIVAVDPSATSTGDEAGIIGAGREGDDFYVLEDASVQGSPRVWATAAVTLYYKLQADRIVAESNQGGEMIIEVVKQVDPNVRVKLVHASRGKQTRAEPIAAIYEPRTDHPTRAHHVGSFPALEDEMCQWVPGDLSPNRMDALVWAATDLMLPSIVSLEDIRRMGRNDIDRSRLSPAVARWTGGASTSSSE